MATTKKKPTINVSKKKKKSAKGKAKKKEFFGLIDLPDDLAERGREIWLAGLGALSMVEEEGVKLFNNLVEKGEQWEKEGRKQLGAAKKKLDEARDKVESTVGDVAEKGSKLAGLDDVVVSAVEDTVETVLQRLGLGVLTLFFVSVIIFSSIEFLPGDFTQAVLGQTATEETVAAFRKELGLDQPAYIRYFDWIGSVMTGDLGQSFSGRAASGIDRSRAVAELVAPRLANTLFLAAMTAIIAEKSPTRNSITTGMR